MSILVLIWVVDVRHQMRAERMLCDDVLYGRQHEHLQSSIHQVFSSTDTVDDDTIAVVRRLCIDVNIIWKPASEFLPYEEVALPSVRTPPTRRPLIVLCDLSPGQTILRKTYGLVKNVHAVGDEPVCNHRSRPTGCATELLNVRSLSLGYWATGGYVRSGPKRWVLQFATTRPRPTRRHGTLAQKARLSE
jgi:hypothetical protein